VLLDNERLLLIEWALLDLAFTDTEPKYSAQRFQFTIYSGDRLLTVSLYGRLKTASSKGDNVRINRAEDSK
jgi:hypothetical protein